MIWKALKKKKNLLKGEKKGRANVSVTSPGLGSHGT